MELTKLAKIKQETNIMHQNKAESMQKFTPWQKNMLFVRESWLFKGGWNFTPPRALVYKKYVGPRRVNMYVDFESAFL